MPQCLADQEEEKGVGEGGVSRKEVEERISSGKGRTSTNLQSRATYERERERDERDVERGR